MCQKDKKPKVIFRDDKVHIQNICKACYKKRQIQYATKQSELKPKPDVSPEVLLQREKWRKYKKPKKDKNLDVVENWKDDLMDYITEKCDFSKEDLKIIDRFLQGVDDMAD